MPKEDKSVEKDVHKRRKTEEELIERVRRRRPDGYGTRNREKMAELNSRRFDELMGNDDVIRKSLLPFLSQKDFGNLAAARRSSRGAVKANADSLLIFAPDNVEALQDFLSNVTNKSKLEILDLSKIDLPLTDELLVDVSSKCKSLKSFILYDCGTLDGTGVVAITREAKNLECLSIPNNEFSVEALKYIFANCKNLVKLDADDSIALDDRAMEVLANTCKRTIKSIYVGGITNFTHEGIDALKCCKKLKVFDVGLQKENFGNDEDYEDNLDISDDSMMPGLQRLRIRFPAMKIICPDGTAMPGRRAMADRRVSFSDLRPNMGMNPELNRGRAASV